MGRPPVLGVRGALVAFASLVLSATAAPAQPAEGEADAPAEVPQDPKLAKKLVEAGQKAAKARQYAEAVNAFEKALAAGADVAVLYDLALAEEKRGKLDRAATHLRRLVGAAGVKADLKKKATARYDELSMKVGLLTLKVEPEGATISLGGETVATAPMAEPVILMPGTYTLSFAAPGHQPKDVEITVEEGSEAERAVELEAVEVIVKPPVDEAPAPVRPIVAPGPSRTPLYVGGGIAVGAVGLGVITGLLATSRHGTFTDPMSTAAEREDARSSGKNLALITDVALGVGVAAAAFTAYWYLAKHRSAQRGAVVERPDAGDDEGGAKVDLAPWVQADAGGLTVVGSF